MTQRNGRGGIMGTIIGVATLALFVFVIYFVLKGFIWFIFAGAWFFLLVAGILDYKVILNFGKRLIDLFKRNPLFGIGATALSVVLYPFLFFILMMRAIGSKFVKRIGFEMPGQSQGNQESEVFVEYEEIEEEILDLKEIEMRKREL